MNKRFLKIFRKYNFIILFSASFAVYMSVMGVQALSQNRREDPTVVHENPSETTDSQTDESGSETTEAAAEETTADEETTEKPTEPKPQGSFTTADASYLDGALFIGDSRTITLSSYSGWDNTTFFVETGLTIWSVMESNIANVGGTTMTVRDALGTQTYDKIYIMLGINELGRGTPDSFCEQYKIVLDEIHSLQPQAVIYLQSIMHVTQSKDDENYYINNMEINARNEKLQTLADNVNVFWLDENEVFDAPGTGKLNPEYTSDGVHLKPMCIDIWQDFLLKHVIKR